MADNKPRLKAICPEPQNYSAAGLSAIGKLAELVSRPIQHEELVRIIPEFDLLFVRLQTAVTRDLLESATRLRAVISPTTGLNHIDLDAAAEFNIEVFHLRGQTEFLRSIPSTAEHTWALLLALVRRVPEAFESVRRGRWEQDPFRGIELHEKHLGVVGCGRLGSIVAHYGRAFGMSVSAFDPYAEFVPSYVDRCGSLEELLLKSDVLSVHVPLNDETTGMIGARQLESLPDGAVLINTSRGEIIDEEALLQALVSGRLSGAAVDVIRNELSPSERGRTLVSYARTHENLIITPHIGGATIEAVEKTDLFIVGRLVEWLKQPVNRLDAP
ncbi:MAG TPA: NAD(P)-dependent oxidoreductase [Rhodothermia bacterium]|nr:NAD(P)-dependent oxidoreductase [Rhodothermia bacterium]